MTSAFVHDGPLKGSSLQGAAACADQAADIEASRIGLERYKGWLASRDPALIAAVRYHERADGIVHVVTEVHGGGHPDALLPVYDAEVVAHRAARDEGGTASYIFEVFDLDGGERAPDDSSYVQL